ncbi:MAG: major capsid protein [Microvirus sp.]|nr:MAG: major capsid protein [Microvirus sp.]
MSKEKYYAQPSGTAASSHFAQVPGAEIERSKFDRSHSYKTTFNGGKLVPVYVDEVLPGDTFHMNSTAFARLATPLKPIMDNMYLDTHFWFVPYRLVWDHWQEFMGEVKNPLAAPLTYTIPQTTINCNNGPASPGEFYLWNFMGLPAMGIGGGGGQVNVSVSSLPFRAYQLIWNEWYRDENLQIPVVVPTGDGPDNYNQTLCLTRGKRKDYFTGALPWPQKGDPVTVPFLANAPVIGNPAAANIQFKTAGSASFQLQLSTPGTTGQVVGPQTPGTLASPLEFGTNTGLIADLTQATAVSINELRTAFQIQRLLERDARGGTRYIELILSHFGVRSDDARLQRPEYLGGGTNMININPIAQTVPQVDSPQANLAAVGTGVNKAGFTKSFTEHGIIIGIISARADLTYQQGVERFWNRKTRYDFYWPALSHLGEQEILNQEIYLQGNTTDKEIWGYQERYAEYRYKPSRITGAFSSEQQTSLDVWHLAQDFQSLPALNLFFIADNPPFKRISAVPSEPDFLLDIWFSLQTDRPMPVYSVPGLIDHF